MSFLLYSFAKEGAVPLYKKQLYTGWTRCRRGWNEAFRALLVPHYAHGRWTVRLKPPLAEPVFVVSTQIGGYLKKYWKEKNCVEHWVYLGNEAAKPGSRKCKGRDLNNNFVK
jgi:hypothetical protein